MEAEIMWREDKNAANEKCLFNFLLLLLNVQTWLVIDGSF